MNNPLVSIIIPLFNAENYIAKCLDSAINQTYLNKEIIIVDDGSTDNSLAIVEGYTNHCIKVFTQKNKGASVARNLGLTVAKGDFIQFLDADDILSINKIENQIKLAQINPNKLIVCSTIHFRDGENYFNEEPSAYEENFLFDTDNPTEFLINLWGGNTGYASMIQPNAWLIPKTVINKSGYWNENLTLDDDGEFFSRVILNSAGVAKEKLGKNYYRKHISQNNLSNVKKWDKLISQLNSTNLKKEHLFNLNSSKNAQIAIANLYLDLCITSYLKNNYVYNSANKELKKIKFRPNLKIIMGGRFINSIANLLNWRIAKWIITTKQYLVLLKFKKQLINNEAK